MDFKINQHVRISEDAEIYHRSNFRAHNFVGKIIAEDNSPVP